MRLDPHAKVLVINVCRIGDTVLATPALQALRRALPHGHLTVLGHPKRVAVLQNLPFIDQLGAITPSRARWLGHFPGQRYDVALVYGGDAPLLKFARRVARYTVGFEQEDHRHHRWLDQVVSVPGADTPAVKQALALPAALGVQTERLRTRYEVLPAEARRAERWVLRHRLQNRPLIGLQVASFPTKPYRDWPLHRFTELMDWLLEDDPRRHFIVLGDALSTPRARELKQHFPEHVTIATGAFNLRDNAALMQQLSLYIGVDTGPTHLAAALGLPMVALYHCLHPSRIYGPMQHPLARTIDHPAPHGRCRVDTDMSEIMVAPVYQAATELLRVMQ
ncbi:glycosyltransferase family 9 protein [Leeia aquatica]|uniref:Glycosyltransferase family 9 protein n=1 Tax=Leeia aquatica TaxID=2725557 RepID=A0A847SC15_9NEIS|nr:glycosyltransferase family 9 protein [Leeia aquatica]NLR76445.1 glycosyltransferase family 9 protein [Leeia aquatica]